MKQNDLLKFLLLGAGAWVLYQFAQQQGWIGGAVAEIGAGEDDHLPAAPPADSTPSVVSYLAPTDDNLTKAAGGDATVAIRLGDGFKLNIHQWNYYRALAKVAAGDAAYVPPAPEALGYGEGMAQVTAMQYLAAIGKSGVGAVLAMRAQQPAWAM
jgi:hypothetical protein